MKRRGFLIGAGAGLLTAREALAQSIGCQSNGFCPGIQWPSFGPALGAVAVAAPLSIPAQGTALAVYSVRQLASWGGNCLRVVRASDSAQLDIGFVNNVINTATMNSFMGSSTLTCTKWYDQSGNGNDAVQSTVANQPSMDGTVSQAVINDSTSINSVASNPFKYLTLPTSIAVNLNNVSVYAALQAKYSAYNNGYFTIGQPSTDYLDLYSYLQDTGTYWVNNGSNIVSNTAAPSHSGSVIGVNGNGTSGKSVVDGVTATGTVGSRALTGGSIGQIYFSSSDGAAANYFAVIIYGTVLSAANQTAIQTSLQATFFPTPYVNQVISDGDSLSVCAGTTKNLGFTDAMVKAFPSYKCTTLAVSGQTLATCLSNIANITGKLSASFTKNIVCIFAGTNDIAAGTAASTVYANLQTYTADIKSYATTNSINAKVVWWTILPRPDFSGAEQTQQGLLNASIRAATLGQSNTADAIADVQSDPTMGPQAASSNLTLYWQNPGNQTAGPHPTNLGNTYLSPYINAAVGSL